MRLLFTILIISGSFFDCLAQVAPAPKFPHEYQDYLNPFEKKKRKRLNYKMNVWKYLYEIQLNDKSIIKANSDILKEKESGNYFIYYSKGDTLRKIYPSETIQIKKPNPYNMQESVEGIPYGKYWRFKVLEGKINAYCYFINGKQITEIQINNGEIITLDIDLLRSEISNTKKAIKALNNRDYYMAIKIYNSKNRS